MHTHGSTIKIFITPISFEIYIRKATYYWYTPIV